MTKLTTSRCSAHPVIQGTTATVLKQVESLGYATRVHQMRAYVEMHAVPLEDPEQLVLMPDGDGDDDQDCYRRACLPSWSGDGDRTPGAGRQWGPGHLRTEAGGFRRWRSATHS